MPLFHLLDSFGPPPSPRVSGPPLKLTPPTPTEPIPHDPIHQ